MIRSARWPVGLSMFFLASLACSLGDLVQIGPEAQSEILQTANAAAATSAAAGTAAAPTDDPNLPTATVTLVPSDTPEPTPTLTPTPTPEPFTSAKFYFFPDQATFTGEASPGSLFDFCSPPSTLDSGGGSLLINDSGEMRGVCDGFSDDQTVHRFGSFLGLFDRDAGVVSFTLETTRIFTPYPGGQNLAVIVLEGTASVLGNTASGTGSFSYSCDAEGESVHCIDDRTTLTLSGTMPFLVEFYP
jgi:hypothetical protein